MKKKQGSTLDRLLTQFEDWSLFLLVMAALLSLFTNVVLRYGFNYTLAWSEELVRIVIIYTTFIGASAAIRDRAMIRIDAAVQLFPSLKPALSVFSNILMLGFSVIVVFFGSQMTYQQYLTQQRTIIMQIPLVAVYAVMPVTGLMMMVRICQIFIINILKKDFF